MGRWKAAQTRMPGVMRQLYDDIDCADLVLITSASPP